MNSIKARHAPGARVVPAVAAFHAQSFLTGRTFAALGEHDAVLRAIDVVGQRATDAAVRTHAVDRVERFARAQRRVDRHVDERAGRANRRALAARHAAALAHRRVEIERDARRVALAGAAEHLIVLQVVTGADAQVAHHAGLVIDGDHRRAGVARARVAGREARPVGPAGVGEAEQPVAA